LDAFPTLKQVEACEYFHKQPGWQLPLKMTGNIGNGKFAVAGRDIIY